MRPSGKTDKPLGRGSLSLLGMRGGGHNHSFVTGALRHIATITKNARRYHVYKVAREADEVY